MTALPNVDFPPFAAHPLVASASLQTVAGAFSWRGLGDFGVRAESIRIRVDEGTTIRVELDRPAERTRGEDRPRSALVVLHGLAGSSESRYVLGTAHKAVQEGFLVARVNARNCGETEELTTTAYNGAETRDLEAAALHVAEHEGIENVHLVGFSIGGNQALRLAARWGAKAPAWLRSVVSISPCIDFAAAADGMNRGTFQRTVQRYFLRSMRGMIRRRAELDPTIDVRDLDRVDTIRAFDERYTAPLSGYADADDYYRRASMRDRLAGIAMPTLLLTSKDDPLVPFSCFEGTIPSDGPVRLVATQRGGHVGFLGWGRGRDRDRRWAENRVLQFVRACESGAPGL